MDFNNTKEEFRLVKKNMLFYIFLVLVVSCKQLTDVKIEPDVITETTAYDADDPAIWINRDDPSKSIVFGTDKDTNGSIYAFNLKGKILRDKTIENVRRPNNVDLRYDFRLNDSTVTDILVFTEREKKQIRIFSVPDMTPLDNGGIPVFADENNPGFSFPMGVSFYKSPKDQTFYVIVSRKEGPLTGYLYQYRLAANDSVPGVTATFVRKFGNFSGKKEIEAIAVDDEMGYVYYSDEQHCIRKYHAEPSMGGTELACFGETTFTEDIEGIAIASFPGNKGYIIVSNQQKGTFNFFSRTTNEFVKELNLSTLETDGCDIVTVPLDSTFSKGLFVAMNDARNFYFYNVDKLGITHDAK
ncbi:phytase [Ascidiimonas aurantiaca]|uniref:phytase n=1 Tax=Ascidiimonas aurantiaca TaxID=1685432 RepID=UPI0030EBD4A4